ncbi:MAG TPA: hypothetical protein VNH11_16755 [Pirellulales bacterium]|nr:hypothetical protein [Pirellulales bacterium]
MECYSIALRPVAAVWWALERLRRRSGAVRRMEAHRASFYQTVWRQAAAAIGAETDSLPDGSLRIGLPGFVTRVKQNWTEADDEGTLHRAGNKPMVLGLLAAEQLPVPRCRQFNLSSLDVAADFLAQIAGNCVVKPAAGTGAGAGVTTHVRQVRQLRWAAARAAMHGRELCIEEQIEGDNYRLLYFDGVLLEAVLRRPPAVTGDGRSSVRALVKRLNRSRLADGARAAQTLITCDLDMRHTLAVQGLSVASVPAAGRRVRLKTAVNENSADENSAAGHVLCPAVIEAGAHAARAVGARLAGVDIITPDPARPLADVGGVVLEVNTTPGLYYHYHRQGGPSAIAVDILNHLLQRQPCACLADRECVHAGA